MKKKRNIYVSKCKNNKQHIVYVYRLNIFTQYMYIQWQVYGIPLTISLMSHFLSKYGYHQWIWIFLSVISKARHTHRDTHTLTARSIVVWLHEKTITATTEPQVKKKQQFVNIYTWHAHIHTSAHTLDEQKRWIVELQYSSIAKWWHRKWASNSVSSHNVLPNDIISTYILY